MNVKELREYLAGMPDEIEVAVAAHEIAGVAVDVAPTAVVGVDHGRRDDGRIEAVWLVAIGDPAAMLPAMLTFRCACGAMLAIHDGDAWPADHLHHLSCQP